MAWRLAKCVVRGEIDNRTRDRVIGRIWVVGREYPIELTLAGNAMRDLAGCVLMFENPNPSADENASLSPIQMGTVGDMTASRKVRLFDVPIEEALDRLSRGEAVSERMGNAVYLEWYSRANGRVVIESADYEISISSHSWRMTAEEETKQSEKNQQSVKQWVDEITAEMHGDADFGDDGDWRMDEFEWEKQLKESDAMTARYGELLEKYMDDPNHEEIIAREMGWSWMEEELDVGTEEDGEGEDEVSTPWLADLDLDLDEVPELVPNPLTEGRDWIRTDDDRIKHPLSEHASRIAMSMWHYCKDHDLLTEEGDSDLHDMLFQAHTLSAKLAGALDSLAYDDDPDCGFVIACLKRSLQYFDNAIRATAVVAEKNLVATRRISVFRDSLFEIRQEIIRLMTHYRQLR